MNSDLPPNPIEPAAPQPEQGGKPLSGCAKAVVTLFIIFFVGVTVLAVLVLGTCLLGSHH
jgi:hypothetical protein